MSATNDGRKHVFAYNNVVQLKTNVKPEVIPARRLTPIESLRQSLATLNALHAKLRRVAEELEELTKGE
jgi:hypothetical protein